MRSQRHFVSILICLLALPISTVKGVPVVVNSLSNKHVNAIVQDADEYIWIGTAKGLYKYNGYEYFHYFHSDEDPSSLPSDLIVELFIDSTGRLWAASDTGILMYDPQSDIFRPCRYIGTSLSVDYGLIESGGQIYSYGINGIKTVSPQTMEVELIKGTEGLTVNTVIEDAGGRILLGCSSPEGIYRAGAGFTNLTPVYRSPATDINCSFILTDGVILFGTNSGIVAIDTSTMSPIGDWAPSTVRRAADKLNITFFHRLDNGTVLVGTQNEGLWILDPKKWTLVPSGRGDLFTAVTSSHCTACFTSLDGMIWLGTFDQGYYTEPGSARRFNADRTLDAHFSGRFVTRIVETANGLLWIGTRYDGLTLYDPHTKKIIAEYNKRNFEPFQSAGGDFIQSLYIDSRGLLWVGYEKKLMWCAVGNNGISSYRVFDIHSDIVSICEDPRGRVWTGSSSDGITVYDVSENRSERLALPMSGVNVTNIVRLSGGNMLVSCYVFGLYTVDPRTGTVREVVLPEEVSNLARRCVSLLATRSGELWIGTYAMGAARLAGNLQDFEILHSLDGGAGSDVVAMAEDDRGCIWMSTSSGLAKFDPETEVVYNFYEHDGTGGNQFHEKAVLDSSDGTIYFGGNHGLTFFRPEEITVDDIPVRVVIEDLKVLNRSVAPGDGTGILKRHISRTDTITLNHRYNVFSLDYTGINYRASHNIKYAYILHGFDADWNYVGNFRRASYSNLAPGEYLFEVKAQITDGVWSKTGTTLRIFVKPAPWFHPAAIFGYVLAALVISLTFVSLHIRGRIDKERIKMVEERRTYENTMNDLKIRFFTNISHELRTPLSLIFGPAKKLLTESEPENSRYLIKLLNHHADNLLRLVDQIMDFAKLESDTLSLGVSPGDPCALTSEIVESYSFYAKEKQIEVEVECDVVGEDVYIDRDKYRKILSNLLSNAIKYTPEGGGGHVDISIRMTGNAPERKLVTQVSDNGIGMSVEEVAQLFKRHKRFGTKGKITENIPGKGIGLHYVRSLVEIHKGGIRAEQGPEGKGMTFTFVIPADADAYKEIEIKDTATGMTAQAPVIEMPYAEEAPPQFDEREERLSAKTAGEKSTLLIVEDNTDLLNFISQIFSREYRVERAVNGAEAVDICRRKSVHLIVSDVIMPVMDGLELCRTVKNDPELSHIPVVLLTAKTMIANQIEGYSTGADAYVSKPVDPALLKSIVAGVLANRERARHSVVKSLGSVSPTSAAEPDGEAASLNPLDRKFLDKLYAYMDGNLSNSELNVNATGTELGFSRTSFYRKVKMLTGYSPNDFLRIYRLRKAAGLLEAGTHTVTEIVDMTGFGTHSYFSRAFKKEFGISPTDFRKTKHPY